MVATGQELTVVEQEILTAWMDEESLAEAVQCYPILYAKRPNEERKRSLSHLPLRRCVDLTN